MLDSKLTTKLKQKPYIIFSFSFILFGAVIAIVTSFINYELEYTNIDKSIANSFELEKLNKLEALDDSLVSLNKMVYTLANSKLTQNFIKQKNPISLDNMQSLFLASANFDPLIMQIRFIDNTGMEVVRVDRSKNAKTVSIVTDDNLQNKKNRYYFIEASQLNPQQFWHSNLDLNYEDGRLEKPHRPTFRVATPVFSENEFSGIVIVNIEATKIIKELTRSTDFDIMIIDGDGEFIYHPNQSLSWSRYLEEKTTFLDLFPVIGQKLLLDTHSKLDDFYSFSVEQQFNNKEQLQLVLQVKNEMLDNLLDRNLLTALIIAITVIIVSFPLSWFAAMIPSRLQSKLQDTLTDLQHTTEILDNNVMSSNTDENGLITSASYAFCKTTGYNLDELQGQNHSLLRHPDTPKKTHESIWNMINNGKIWRGEIHNQTKTKVSYWISTVISPQFGHSGEIIGFTEISEDISARKEVELLSITDALTQLYNRRKIDLVLDYEMERFNRYDQAFSVILLDLDHFKQVNDTYGHQVGDHILIETAKILAKNTRQVDSVGRWGGEEFLIILTGTDQLGAIVIAEKLREAINKNNFEKAKNISASFGVAQCQKEESLSKLISRVDTALYHAKSTGRNRVSTYKKAL